MTSIRKMIFGLAVALALSASANTVSLSGGTGHPGDEVTVTLSMSGSDAVTALEAVIPLGDYLSYAEGSATLNSSRSDGHQLAAAAVGGNLRIYAYSLGLKPFKGSEGALLTFKLRLGATAADLSLTPTVMLSNATGDAVPSSASGTTVTVLSPMLQINTPRIDYGHVPIRSSYEAALSLCNIGNEPLSISDIVPDNSELVVTPSALTIAVGASADVTVTYSPLLRGSFSAKLDVVSNAVNAKKYGKWLSTEVVADPFSVNELFVDPASGASDTEATVTLRMANMEPIVGVQASFNLPDALQYVDGSVAVASRGANHQASASIDGDRLTVFAYSISNAPFAGDEGDVLTFKVRLDGRNGWYWLQPDNVILSNATLENMTSAVYGEYVVIESPTIYGDSSLDFGKQSITSQMTASYTVGNSGQTALVIDRVAFLAEGYSVTTPLPMTLEPRQEGTIEVSHTAGEPGPFATTMNVYSNDPEQRVLQVGVSGVGYSPNELALDGRYNDDCSAFVLGVSLDNEAPLAAVQFDITVTPTSAVVGDPVIAKSARLDRHDANAYDMGNGTWKVLIFSMTNQAIAPADAELLALSFPMASGSPEATFALAGTVLSSTSGTNIESPELSAVRTYQFKNPSAVYVDKATMSLQIGQSGQLSATVAPADATDTSVTWISSNEAIATVDANGTVVAVGVGTTTIIASSWNGLTAECELTVAPILAESVALDMSAMTLQIGATGQLTATVFPDNTTDKTLDWASTNPAVATVSDQGIVTAVSVGSAIIKVSCGSAFAICEVTVNPVPAESVALSKSEMTLIVGQSGQLTATVMPENTTFKDVVWTTSDAGVAAVSADGTVTAVSVGAATITATCGSASASCAVTVDPVLAEGVVLDKASVTMLLGGTDKLTATVIPETTTDKTVAWSTSDASVVAVSSDGALSAVGLGTATVTASINGKSATCEVTVDPVPAESVALNKAEMTLIVGQSGQLTATVMPENTTFKDVSWTTSDAGVAAVSADGTVTAVSVGAATITATCGSASASCAVTVDPVLAEGVVLDKASVTMLLGGTDKLTATVLPETTTDKTVAWSTSDASVVAVSSDGALSAVGLGTATVTASINGKSASCEVTVNPVPAESVALSKSEMTLIVGQSGQLTATVMPENTTFKDVVWATSDTGVATVSADGTVTAVSVGAATITATCGSASASCAVTVDPVLAEGVVLDKASVTMLLGGTDKLTATVIPETTTDKTVAWSTSDASVVAVSSDGALSAVGLGTATVTASINGKSASCEVTVIPVPAESISLDKTSVMLEIGTTEKLVATVAPDNATDKTVTWASSDNTIVAVDSDGNLMALAIGEADITATTVNGLTAMCHVTVVPKAPATIELNYSSLTLNVGQTADLVATVLPEDAGDRSVTWASTDETVATVDVNGRVKALKGGAAVISATTVNGLTAECQVTVNKLENTIIWEQTFEEVLEGEVLTLTAYSTSQLPVTYSITRGSTLATIEGDKLTILAAGEIEVTANQEGDDTWQAAQPVSKTITAYSGLTAITADSHITVVSVAGVVVYRGEMREMPKLQPGLYIINNLKVLIK